jgi:hypothetical protein
VNPYHNLPRNSYWKNFVNSNFELSGLMDFETKFHNKILNVSSGGSCFAANIIPHLKNTTASYIVTEATHSFLAENISKYNYDTYSAKYGNIYTPRQLDQLIGRAMGEFSPKERFWIHDKEFVDPFRPGLSFNPQNLEQYDLINKSHLASVIRVFEASDTFVFTLGMSEAWFNSDDGSVYPSCPGTIKGKFDSKKHKFINFSVDHIYEDLKNSFEKMKLINKNIKMILTVSPVPMLATVTKEHIAVANNYSKSKLVVAAREIANDISEIEYFPSYELVIGSYMQSCFENDRRSVRSAHVEKIMELFKRKYGIMRSDKNSGLNDQSAEVEEFLNRECEESAYEKYI